MRRVIRYTGDPREPYDVLDLNDETHQYTEYAAQVPHPPDFTTANNILISRPCAIANASTVQTKRVALCVLAMHWYTNLFLLKEWLQLAIAPGHQFMLFIHAKNQAAVREAVQREQLPIDTEVLGEVETQWSSIGIVEASWLLFDSARRKGCKGAVLMSSDSSPIKNPNAFHKDVINQDGPVRGGFRKPRGYPFTVGEQWLSFNEEGLKLLRDHVTREMFYSEDLLQHMEAIHQHGPTNSLHYENDLRTAQIQDRYEGLAPDEVFLQALLIPHLNHKGKQVARSRISWMEYDEAGDHATTISVDYLRRAPPTFLTARKIVTPEAYNQVRRMWTFV